VYSVAFKILRPDFGGKAGRGGKNVAPWSQVRDVCMYCTYLSMICELWLYNSSNWFHPSLQHHGISFKTLESCGFEKDSVTFRSIALKAQIEMNECHFFNFYKV
jgi:hypothetical protein